MNDTTTPPDAIDDPRPCPLCGCDVPGCHRGDCPSLERVRKAVPQ